MEYKKSLGLSSENTHRASRKMKTAKTHFDMDMNLERFKIHHLGPNSTLNKLDNIVLFGPTPKHCFSFNLIRDSVQK
jgi:hypothetical protein